MKTKTPILLLIAFAALFLTVSNCAAQVSVGVTIGAPPPPRVVAVRPVAPGPDFAWVEGYWYVQGHKWRWHPGYWTRVPYAGARWVAPRYERGQFYMGYWEGDRGRFEHDHHWDRDRYRDYDRRHDDRHD
jgi:hypothetical protein